MTPGAYLAKRREAAGLSIADIAAVLATSPKIAEHARIEWIELIERDEMPAVFGTVAALHQAFEFDLAVLEALALGYPVQLCRVCACSDDDPCDGGCAWAEPDLCTACRTQAP